MNAHASTKALRSLAARPFDAVVGFALSLAGLLALASCGKDEAPPIVRLPAIADAQSMGVNLATTPAGQVVMSWIQRTASGAELRFSILEDRAWRAPTVIAHGDDWFVNWADFPSVVPIDDDTWAAHWLVRSGDATYAYDVVMSVSTDAGQAWSSPVSPHSDGTPTEHGFVSLFPWRGDIGAVWLDGRKTINEYDAQNPTASGMTLRGAVMQRDGSLRQESLIDDLVCDCCQTDVALTASGPIVAYRNRTTNEVRDVFVARTANGDWQPGERIDEDGWEIAGCPVNGPALDADGNRVAASWFTGARDTAVIRIAFSEDGGQRFGPAIDVAIGATLGRVDTLLTDEGDAIVSSLHGIGNGRAEIRLQRVSPDGRLHPPLAVAETSVSRLSGFPRVARHPEGLIVAWTDAQDERTTVVTALVDSEQI